MTEIRETDELIADLEPVTDDWLTISEIADKYYISRHKIMYWIKTLAERNQARKTGNRKQSPWLVHTGAVPFLREEHQAGRKPKEIDAAELQEWREKYKECKTVEGCARHFGVVWQTAARRLDAAGVRDYDKPDRRSVALIDAEDVDAAARLRNSN